MTPDEIQAAIERAEAKAQEFQSLDGRTAPALKVFAMLPRAAEAYRRQIVLGLEGEPEQRSRPGQFSGTCSAGK
jgi:hypothetical protein